MSMTHDERTSSESEKRSARTDPKVVPGPDEQPTRFSSHQSEALVVDAKRLAMLLSCGLRTLRTWDATGKVPKPIRIGGRVVWRVTEIHAWIDAGAPDRESWERVRGAWK